MVKCLQTSILFIACLASLQCHVNSHEYYSASFVGEDLQHNEYNYGSRSNPPPPELSDQAEPENFESTDHVSALPKALGAQPLYFPEVHNSMRKPYHYASPNNPSLSEVSDKDKPENFDHSRDDSILKRLGAPPHYKDARDIRLESLRRMGHEVIMSEDLPADLEGEFYIGASDHVTKDGQIRIERILSDADIIDLRNAKVTKENLFLPSDYAQELETVNRHRRSINSKESMDGESLIQTMSQEDFNMANFTPQPVRVPPMEQRGKDPLQNTVPLMPHSEGDYATTMIPPHMTPEQRLPTTMIPLHMAPEQQRSTTRRLPQMTPEKLSQRLTTMKLGHMPPQQQPQPTNMNLQQISPEQQQPNSRMPPHMAPGHQQPRRPTTMIPPHMVPEQQQLQPPRRPTTMMPPHMAPGHQPLRPTTMMPPQIVPVQPRPTTMMPPQIVPVQPRPTTMMPPQIVPVQPRPTTMMPPHIAPVQPLQEPKQSVSRVSRKVTEHGLPINHADLRPSEVYYLIHPEEALE